MDADLINFDNVIFNPNDYAEKTGDVDIKELDERYVNVEGDTMNHLNVSSIQLYEHSTISFADNTIQTTAFNQDVVNNMIEEYNTTNQIVNSDNTFTGNNTFDEDVRFKKYIRLLDTIRLSNSLNIVLSNRRAFYDNPVSGGTHDFWCQGRNTLSISSTNITLRRSVIGVPDITFLDGTKQTTAFPQTEFNALKFKTSSITYVNIPPVPNATPGYEKMTFDSENVEFKGNVIFSGQTNIGIDTVVGKSQIGRFYDSPFRGQGGGQPIQWWISSPDLNSVNSAYHADILETGTSYATGNNSYFKFKSIGTYRLQMAWSITRNYISTGETMGLPSPPPYYPNPDFTLPNYGGSSGSTGVTVAQFTGAVYSLKLTNSLNSGIDTYIEHHITKGQSYNFKGLNITNTVQNRPNRFYIDITFTINEGDPMDLYTHIQGSVPSNLSQPYYFNVNTHTYTITRLA